MRIITAAANLIKNKTIYIRYETNVYPSKADIELGSEFLPPPFKIVNESFSGTRFKTSIIGPMCFKSNETEVKQ